MQFDHIAICATDLAAGTAHVEEALGVPLRPGGRHDRYGTHNRILGLGEGLYLEVIAPDPEAAAPASARWFGLDKFSGPPRPANWICAVDNLENALKNSPEGCGLPRDLIRDDLRWRIAVPDDGSLPLGGAWPTMIEWGEGVTPPGRALPDSGVRLTGWEVHCPNADAIAAQLPLADPRISFHEGALRFVARFDTPRGAAILE